MSELSTKPLRKEMEKIVWSTTHKDFKGVTDGVKYVIYLKPGYGTVSEPLHSIPDAVLEDKFKLAAKIWENKKRKAGDAKEWHHDEEHVYWGPHVAFLKYKNFTGWTCLFSAASRYPQERLIGKAGRDVIATYGQQDVPAQKIQQTVLWLLNHK